MKLPDLREYLKELRGHQFSLSTFGAAVDALMMEIKRLRPDITDADMSVVRKGLNELEALDVFGCPAPMLPKPTPGRRKDPLRDLAIGTCLAALELSRKNCARAVAKLAKNLEHLPNGTNEQTILDWRRKLKGYPARRFSRDLVIALGQLRIAKGVPTGQVVRDLFDGKSPYQYGGGIFAKRTALNAASMLRLGPAILEAADARGFDLSSVDAELIEFLKSPSAPWLSGVSALAQSILASAERSAQLGMS